MQWSRGEGSGIFLSVHIFGSSFLQMRGQPVPPTEECPAAPLLLSQKRTGPAGEGLLVPSATLAGRGSSGLETERKHKSPEVLGEGLCPGGRRGGMSADAAPPGWKSLHPLCSPCPLPSGFCPPSWGHSASHRGSSLLDNSKWLRQ